MTARRKQNPQTQVDAWNAKYPIGTKVGYSSFPGAELKVTLTTTEAQVLSGHTAVVWIEGVSGCVCVENCKAIA